jgi:hypothetical protein
LALFDQLSLDGDKPGIIMTLDGSILADVKTKLQMKSDQNILLEKQLIDIMEILNISGESRSFS